MNRLWSSVGAFVAVSLLGISSFAQASGSGDATAIRIKNFGRVNDAYYRGAQPEGTDYADLARMGVKAIVDVHEHGPKNEQQLAERAGLRFYRIPLNENDAPTAQQVETFLKLVNDPANQPVFVHCAGGRHRTGALTAVYRKNHDNWTADQAFAEMTHYEFLRDGDHTKLKNFVYEYCSRPENTSATKSNVAAR